MSGAEVIALLKAAVDAGLALAEVVPWAQQQHPTLRDEALPDAEGAMLAARAKAEERT